MLHSPFKLFLRIYARELVRQSYRGLLSREADAAGLKAYTKKLRQSPDLAGLLRDLSCSNEHWAKSMEVRAPELVRALFRSLLQREPEAEALASYAARLAETRDLTPLMTAIARSDEHWARTLEARAPELMRAILTGLLNRVPNPEEIQRYATQLKDTRQLTSLLTDVSRSEELWEQLLASRAPQFVEAIFRILLERDADPEGLQTYSKVLLEPDGVSLVMARIMASPEFMKLQQREAVVFLHIQKTAGTSMQHMLGEVFGKKLYAEHTDTLASHKTMDLSAYSVFAGHFNFDTLRHLPRRRLSIFTFVREPKERLLSLYYFLRAHEPTAPAWDEGMVAANKYLVEDYFAREEFKTHAGMWNHMTFAVMGRQKWATWRSTLKGLDSDGIAAFISQTAGPAIRERIREFAFVGLQRDYANSVNILCRILNWPPFENLRKDHSLSHLTQNNPHFKKRMERQPRTERLERLLDDFVQLDNVVYDESERLYAIWLAKYAGDAPTPATEPT